MKSIRKAPEKKKEGWKKPMEGKLMINIDATFDIDSGRGAAGVIVRDYMWVILWLQRKCSYRM
jgi:hypothetical protein